MRKLLLLSFLFVELSSAGACRLAILGFFGIYKTEIRRMPTPTQTQAGVQLKPGYHASPNLTLNTLDPAFSRTALRYGPGVYLYVNSEHAVRHATSINKGLIKKDRRPHPAVVYEGWVDVTHVFDTQKSYTRSELQFILDNVPAQNLARLKIDEIEFPISGEIFYTLLGSAFISENPKNLPLDIATKETAHREWVREIFIKSGINTILGIIPDPNTGEWHPAYISLVPVAIK